MTRRKRIDTLRLLVKGNGLIAGSTKSQTIEGELRRLDAVQRRRNADGWLLSVLHTTRVLDTTLAVLIKAKGWPTTKFSLGSYLVELDKRSVLTSREQSSYQRRIVKKRNKYMHEAGAMPHGLESDRILTDMQECLEQVLRRIG
ncbi:hypothetical protein [Pseudonocardia sp. MH-G8]|uniref:hypothetical protein n=1 Tax=Pseudonocardia sp. MH-G8 TaxID=1854588 RepID=UPI00117A5A50|nr:hypothetical protein [Pseudonocardia sp. MH-G8]